MGSRARRCKDCLLPPEKKTCTFYYYASRKGLHTEHATIEGDSLAEVLPQIAANLDRSATRVIIWTFDEPMQVVPQTKGFQHDTHCQMAKSAPARGIDCRPARE